MPETTRSNFCSTTPSRASATQSDGAPSLTSAGEPSASFVLFTRKGRSRVLTCPPPDQFRSGAGVPQVQVFVLCFWPMSHRIPVWSINFVKALCATWALRVCACGHYIILPCVILSPSSCFLFYSSLVRLFHRRPRSFFIFDR